MFIVCCGVVTGTKQLYGALEIWNYNSDVLWHTSALGCVASVITSCIVLSQDQVSIQGDVMLQYCENNLTGHTREE